MKLKLLFFGVLTDITGFSETELVTDIADVKSLNAFLQNEHLFLKKYSYNIAVNQEIIADDKKLIDGDEIAFLPPFSGG
jgi:molybdopterin converting factor subunit 1